MSSIFLSYATQNREFVDKIRRELEDRNYTTWMDHCEIEGGQEWEIELAKNVKNCKIFIVTVTDASNQSRWVRRETILAEQLQKIRIPLLLQGDIPFRLLDLQFVDFRTSYEEGLSRLLRRLESLLSSSNNDESMVDGLLLNGEFPTTTHAFETTTLGSTIVNFIIDRWISKKGTSKVHKVKPPYRSRYKRIDQRHRKEELRQKQISQQAHRKSQDASRPTHTYDPLAKTNQNFLSNDGKNFREAIKGLLFCVPHGWLEDEIPTEEQAEEDKAFLCKARNDLSAANKQQKEGKGTNESGRLAAAIEDFLENLLDHTEHTGRTCRSKIKIGATGTILLRLNVNNKELGLDLLPNSENYKLLLEGLESLLSALLTKSPGSVFLGGTWPGSIVVLFRAPDSVLNFIVDRWQKCHNDELVLTNEIRLVGLYDVFSATVPEDDADTLLGCQTVSDTSAEDLSSKNPLLRLCTTLIDALQGLLIAHNKETDETIEIAKTDFVACHLDNEDNITFLIPESNHALDEFFEVESPYWVSGSSLQLSLGGNSAITPEFLSVPNDSKAHQKGAADSPSFSGPGLVKRHGGWGQMISSDKPPEYVEKASLLSGSGRRNKEIVDQSAMMNPSSVQESTGQGGQPIMPPLPQHSRVVKGRVISGQELKKYAERHGLCTICGQYKTHKKRWSWFRRKLEPLTIKNNQGVVTVYKGYCIQPTCYPSVGFVKELLHDEKRSFSRASSLATVQTQSTDDFFDQTRSLTKENSSYQSKMRTPENPGGTLSQNTNVLQNSISVLGLDEMRDNGDLTQNVIHIETPRGKPIEEVYEGVYNGPVLGSGSCGLVRLVTHRATGVRYAAKSLDLSLMNSEAHLAQFRQEILTMSKVDHPNIVRLDEVYESHSEVYLIQELCLGGELFDRLDEQPDFHYAESECARLVKQMLSAVRYLHSKGIMHRNLKLEDFLFSSTESDSELKLIDFGLSKHFRQDEVHHEAVGTPYTVAPEVLKGSYDEKCDIWAIGVITFLLLSGEPPFGGCGGPESLMTVRSKILSGEFAFEPAEIWATVSDDGKNFVQTMLAKDPKDRPNARSAQRHNWLRKLLRRKDGAALNPNVTKAMVEFKDYSHIRKILSELLSFTLFPDQVLELRQEFEKLDHDGLGEIDLKTMKDFLSTNVGAGSSGVLEENEVEELFGAMRLTKTKTRIRWHDFLAASLSQCKVDDRNFSLAFNRLDRDHKGYITLDDIVDLIGPDESYSQEEMQIMRKELMESLDCDPKRVSYEKFLTLMKKFNPSALEPPNHNG